MLGSILGSIGASVGGSLVSGLLNKGKKTTQSTDLKKMVADAQAAGFNPATVLQATGGQGWGSQVSSNDFDVGSMAASAALQGVGDYFAGQQERDLLDAQINLAKAQIQNLASPVLTPTFGGQVQDVSDGRQTSDATGQAVTNAGPPINTDPQIKTGFGVTNASQDGEPREAEADLWLSLLAGRIQEDAGAIIDSNTSPEMAAFLRVWGKSVNPNPYIRAGKKAGTALQLKHRRDKARASAGLYGRNQNFETWATPK